MIWAYNVAHYIKLPTSILTSSVLNKNEIPRHHGAVAGVDVFSLLAVKPFVRGEKQVVCSVSGVVTMLCLYIMRLESLTLNIKRITYDVPFGHGLGRRRSLLPLITRGRFAGMEATDQEECDGQAGKVRGYLHDSGVCLEVPI